MILQLVTPASSYPITLDELKAHLYLDTSDDDSRLTSLIAAATDYIESYTNRAYVQQTWKMVLPGFPASCHWPYFAVPQYPRDHHHPSAIELPRPPLVSITNIKYYDYPTNTLQTLNPSTDYRVVTGFSDAGWVEPVDSWPGTFCRMDAVQIQFVAGYSSAPPELLKHAVKILCGAWNTFRESEVMGTTQQTVFGLDRILNQLQNYHYGPYGS